MAHVEIKELTNACDWKTGTRIDSTIYRYKNEDCGQKPANIQAAMSHPQPHSSKAGEYRSSSLENLVYCSLNRWI